MIHQKEVRGAYGRRMLVQNRLLLLLDALDKYNKVNSR